MLTAHTDLVKLLWRCDGEIDPDYTLDSCQPAKPFRVVAQDTAGDAPKEIEEYETYHQAQTALNALRRLYKQNGSTGKGWIEYRNRETGEWER